MVQNHLFDQIFSTLPGPDPKILRFEQKQPEHRISFVQYRNSRADHYKIMIGRKEYKKNQMILSVIGHNLFPFPKEP